MHFDANERANVLNLLNQIRDILQPKLVQISAEDRQRYGSVSEENKKTIFKRFERRSTTVGGFGIGLDIVNSVCEMYHINVWIESIPNKETTFHLQFPHV